MSNREILPRLNQLQLSLGLRIATVAACCSNSCKTRSQLLSGLFLTSDLKVNCSDKNDFGCLWMLRFQSLGNLTLALKSSVLVSVRDKSSSYTPRLIGCELWFHHIHWSLSSSLEPKLSRCSAVADVLPVLPEKSHSASVKCLMQQTPCPSFSWNIVEFSSMY